MNHQEKKHLKFIFICLNEEFAENLQLIIYARVYQVFLFLSLSSCGLHRRAFNHKQQQQEKPEDGNDDVIIRAERFVVFTYIDDMLFAAKGRQEQEKVEKNRNYLKPLKNIISSNLGTNEEGILNPPFHLLLLHHLHRSK